MGHVFAIGEVTIWSALKLSRVEDRGIFITRSPFAVRECVDREVYD